MRQAILLSLCTLLLFACGPETAPTLFVDPALTGARSASVVLVPPSGDATGQTDPVAIAAALNATQPGDVVLLSDGDPTTVDHYYASEGVVVLPGFDGTLSGEGASHTIVHAIPRPDGSEFAFTFNSSYVNVPTDPTAGIWPTVFHFEFPVAVTVRDLAITQADPAPSAGFFQHITVWGGDPDVLVTGLNLSDPGWTPNSAGVHVMGGPQSGVVAGMGSVEIRGNEFKGLMNAVVPMWYGPGADIDVRGNHFRQVGRDVWALDNAPTSFHIAEGTHRSTRNVAVRLDRVNGVKIKGNAFVGGRGAGIIPLFVQGAEISHNRFQGSYATAFWHANVFAPAPFADSRIAHNTFEDLGYASGAGLAAAIQLLGPVTGTEIDHNSFVMSGLPGWTPSHPGGPGAVFLAPPTSQNTLHEMQFGPGPGKALCQMVLDLTDDPTTPGYDGANQIHNWRPCGNLAARGIHPPGPFDPNHGPVPLY